MLLQRELKSKHKFSFGQHNFLFEARVGNTFKTEHLFTSEQQSMNKMLKNKFKKQQQQQKHSRFNAAFE